MRQAVRSLSWSWWTTILILWFFAGALLFCTSMLSTSTVMPQTATEVCEGLSSVDQVVVLLLDAMRPDFSLPRLRGFAQHGGDCRGGEAVVEAYGREVGHTLTYIEQSLRDTSRLSQGYFLVADAPTTTAQRIKAIATGTMPAFLEAGSNFNSEATELDSFVRQAQGRAVILGDDTWTKLFPNESASIDDVTAPSASADASPAARAHWKMMVDVPSFDVADFDSNDNAVLGNIYNVLERETREGCSGAASPAEQHAKLVIGHFLGVDHIGHRLNADNPTMHAKLSQLDDMLHNVSRLLRERPTTMRTMLLVLGDHGMTNSGDHGGESVQETDTFLYAEYFPGQGSDVGAASGAAKSRLRADRLSVSRWAQRDDPELHRLEPCQAASGIRNTKLGATYQVDVTSTIAVLMGRPIPFSNFGRVVPEVLALADPNVDVTALEACNARQFQRYADAAAMRVPPRTTVNCSVDGTQDANELSPHAVAQRQYLAQFSYYARKTRSVMNKQGMFIGSWMLLVAALSLLWIADVQRCLIPGHLADNWTLLVVVGRLVTVFSNSFVTNEDTELFTLLNTLFWLSLVAWCGDRLRGATGTAGGLTRWGGPVLVAAGVMLFRQLAPYAYRHRFPITHAVESRSAFELWASHRPVPERVGLLLGGVLCLALYGRTRIACAALTVTVVVMCAAYKVPRWHHVVPVGLVLVEAAAMRFCRSRRSSPSARVTGDPCLNSALYRYLVWVLWCAMLCNEGVVAAGVIAVYGCALPFLVRALRQFASDTSVAVQLHLLSYVVFFLQGHQCMLSTIDWNSSFVGMSGYSLVGGGVLVLSRTFNAFLFVPVACALQDTWAVQAALFPSQGRTTPFAPRSRRLRHYVQHIVVLQAAVACFNGYIQKSHLMLYPIFCPKYLFDVVIALMTGAATLLSFLVTPVTTA